MAGFRTRLVFGRDMFSCLGKGSRGGVETWPLVFRLGSCKGAEVGSRHTFWCRNMGQATQCRDTILSVTTWVDLLGLR